MSLRRGVAVRHEVGSALDRRARSLACMWWTWLFLMAVIGGLMVAPESIGPLITVGVWSVVLVCRLVRNSRAGRGEPHMISLELVPVIGAVVVIQLLLDLHTRWLGDAVVAALHAIALAWVLFRRVATRQHRDVR